MFDRERPFLLLPTSGYPLALAADEETEIRSAYGALLAGGRPQETRAVAARLLERNPGLHPAALLIAQADHVERFHDAAIRRLAPVVDELPGYTPARLLLARAAESAGDLPLAFDAYRVLAGELELAAARALEIRPRTLEIVGNRLDEALARGHLEEAADQLERLQEWAPEETPTLRAAQRVAAAVGDAATELSVVRELAVRLPDDVDLQTRLAELELEVGQPSSGLRVLQELAAADPGNRELAERLARAKFRFRLVLLPPRARDLVELPELSRGDFAYLLYWLFPSVRYGVTEEATIANDVFGHPFREEIVRVVNQGLMSVEPTLHRFEPERRLVRSEALASLLALLGQGERQLSCLSGARPPGAFEVARVCSLAGRCGLIGDEAECLPAGAVAGSDALEMCRRALELLGVG